MRKNLQMFRPDLRVQDLIELARAIEAAVR
jgi:hypothetical protein